MTAVTQDRYGDSSVLRTTTVAVPTPGPDQVLVRVHAAGIDRGTEHLVSGTPYLVRAMFGLRRPRQPIPGMDMAGTVVASGSEVTRFAPGDEVVGVASGSFAEYAVADESKVTLRPDPLPVIEAAVVPISGSTAHQAVVTHGAVSAGDNVLILGASGGVGSYAVQIAKARGAIVTGVASGPKLDMVRSLGADHVIDYRSADPVDGTRRYDIIIDIGGRNRLSKLRRALTDDGTLVIVGGEGGDTITGGIGRQLRAAAMSPFVSQRLTFFIASEDHRHLDELLTLVASGKVRPRLDRTYRLSQVPDALDDLAAGRIAGKAVITITDPSVPTNERARS
ncbi:MAG: NAD(P)-dependent alcohol dehydrogenase [Acidimicrobiia bacterium]|nr:NAD(P)-dependent alcohol dehydrogenase [Acidimicrobiia bacterium]